MFNIQFGSAGIPDAMKYQAISRFGFLQMFKITKQLEDLFIPHFRHLEQRALSISETILAALGLQGMSNTTTP